MTSKQKQRLLVGGALLVAAYLIYRWYVNKQQANQATQGEGTNLNSSFPALVAGSTGPQSGLNYTPAPINVTVTQPVVQGTSSGPLHANKAS